MDSAPCSRAFSHSILYNHLKGTTLKINKILVSQPQGAEAKKYYDDIAQKYGVQIDFKQFIRIESLTPKEFRAQKVSILPEHSAIIFTSRHAIDHFFQLCQEMRVTIPETLKYFCITETVSLYIQKYVQYRKRKVFFGTTGKFDSLLPQMGDGMAKSIGATLSSSIGSTLGSIGNSIEGLLSSGIGSMIGIIAQIPKLILDLVNAIKNFVTGILNAITELISLRWIDDLVVSILDAVGNLIDAIFDLPENLYHVLEGIVVKGVGGLLDSVIGRIGNILTFGALSSSVSDWFTNSNAAEVAATIDRLTKRNELLEQAIEDLTDEMKSSRGASAIDASQRARKLQEETNANYKSIAQAQAGYHGSHHSWNYYWGGYNEEQINRLSQQIGRQWNGDLWNLSPEEMKMLRSNVDMWEQIQNSGKGGYGNSVANKLNDYIDQAGKLQEITDALYETLTTTTKDDVFDGFLNSLYDLADGSEGVMDRIADNWQKMVNRMAINNLVGAKFQKNLEAWYENLAKLNESRTNGEITDEEYRKRLDALKAQYEGYVESAKRDIETLRSEGIVKATEENSSVSQSGKAGAFTTMSQDQAGKLEGLFVSGQIHWASIDDKLTDVSRQMNEAGDHLRQIATNTGNSASSLGEIKEDIKKMIRDGLKMK